MENQSAYSIIPLHEHHVTRVCGVAFPDSAEHDIDLVFVILHDPPKCYRFCLGEGVAYYDVVSHEEATAEIQEYKSRTTDLIDCDQELYVTLAHEFELENGSPAQISIDFSNGLNLGFRCRPAQTNGSTEVLIRPVEQAERKIAQ